MTRQRYINGTIIKFIQNIQYEESILFKHLQYLHKNDQRSWIEKERL